MATDFKTFNAIINPILAAKYPVLIRGRHGIGKSELVYQTANNLGLPVVERRASQMTEGRASQMTEGDFSAYRRSRKV